MMTRICDRCGRPMFEGELRYVAKVEVFAAADPLAISLEDLKRDHREEYERLLEQCEGRTEEELMRDVYVSFKFDLCRRCQQAYILNPLHPAAPPPKA